MANERIFPPEYYKVCTSNYSNKKINPWICNQPLSPAKVRVNPNATYPETSAMENDSDNFSPFYDSDSDPEYCPSSTENSENEYMSGNSPTNPEIPMSLNKTNCGSKLNPGSIQSINIETNKNNKYCLNSTDNSEDEHISENSSIISIESMLCVSNCVSTEVQEDKNKKKCPSNTENSEDEYESENSTTVFEEPMSLDEANSVPTEAKKNKNNKICPRSTNNSDDKYVSESSPTVSKESNSLDEANCVSKSSHESIHITEGEKGEKKKNRPKRKFDFCFYCETDVSNFARHLYRNHKAEFDVQKLLSYPIKSKKRNELLDVIRKKGNYLKNTENGKPVRIGTESTTYLPCIHCLGFYSSKNLWRHRQQCSENPDKKSSTKGTKSRAQTMQLGYLKLDPELKEKVFPHMRADKISFTAKKDPLICAFGARYLKTHREKHFISVASRKMRELARLLIEIKKKEPSIKNFFSVLKPQYFDLLISSTKSVSEYNYEKDFFKSPTYAINMGTTLKQCCDIALLYALKKKDFYETLSSAETESDLKTLTRLIENNWKFDISSQACNDLQSNRWNKVTIVPLASDLKLLKDYLIKTAMEAVNSLNEHGTNEVDYIKLLQTVFCRLVLLNRKRPGELQRFLLRTYEDSQGKEISKTYEEFSEVITETEKALMKHFKRVVIRGKRGRGVPVLFSQDIQEHIQILLQHRTTIMQKPNLYLFGNPKSSEPIVGYKVLKKYAAECGAKNPDALTCTRLRKHLATLTQLFNLTENDMEQLATFMGHTLSIHKSSYRLPDDVYQTAKVSKLLMLMEKGIAGQFKGKTLDEIDLDMDENLMEMNLEEKNVTERAQEIYDDVESDKEENCDTINDKSEHVLLTETKNKTALGNNKNIKKVTKRVLVPWTDEQKTLTCSYFKKHIKIKRPPKRGECEMLISEHPEVFRNKDWLKIKVFVQNKYSQK